MSLSLQIDLNVAQKSCILAHLLSGSNNIFCSFLKLSTILSGKIKPSISTQSTVLPTSGLFVQLIVEQRDTCLTAPWGQREWRLFYQTCHCTITKQCSVSPVADDKLHLIYSCVTCRPQTAVRHIWNEGLCQILPSVCH